jgi:hypothetical protein
MKNGDGFVLVLLIAIFLIWGLYGLRRWWSALPDRKMDVEADEEIPVTEAVALLESAGYEVLTVKRRIPIAIQVDGGSDCGGEDLESRLYIDHWARFEDRLYLVKVERERKPYEWTGSGLRDRLLVYALLYEDAAGLIVVSLRDRRIRKVEFEIER